VHCYEFLSYFLYSFNFEVPVEYKEQLPYKLTYKKLEKVKDSGSCTQMMPSRNASIVVTSPVNS